MSEQNTSSTSEHAAEPIPISDALAGIDRLWSPHILARVNDHEVRLAKVAGNYIWHVHDDTDELFFVVDGHLEIGLREAGRERTVSLERGSVFVVPRGTEHRPSSPEGASVLLIEAAGTLSTGDQSAADIPAHIDSTRGRDLA